MSLTVWSGNSAMRKRMRKTSKGQPPPCLKELKKHQEERVEAARTQWAQEEKSGSYIPSTKADWKGCAKELRTALCKDQRWLCAYCMQRIQTFPEDRADEGEIVPSTPKETKMGIEHFVARSAKWELMYEWSNLLGVCCGKSRNDVHCDEARGDLVLHYDPATSLILERGFTYSRQAPSGTNGRGYWVRGNTSNAKSDIEHLNLNAPALAANRIGAIDHVRKKMSVLSGNPAKSRKFAQKRLAAARSQNPPAFAPLVEEYLQAKLDKWNRR